MSIFKNSDQKVEKFEFNKFSSAVVKSGEAETFNFNKIDPNTIPDKEIDQETIRLEREYASKNDFKFDKTVKEYRGLKSQEEHDFQNRLDVALKVKFEELSQKAFEEGLEKGREAGRQEALALASEKIEASLTDIYSLFQDIQTKKDALLLEHKEDIYSVVKSISKWVALKEIRDDESSYLQNLIQKLISEINTKNNISLKVAAKNYNLMPEVIESIEKKLGELQNIRFEISPEIENEGVILESSNGIIDASIEAQFATIDHFFESGN